MKDGVRWKFVGGFALGLGVPDAVLTTSSTSVPYQATLLALFPLYLVGGIVAGGWSRSTNTAITCVVATAALRLLLARITVSALRFADAATTVDAMFVAGPILTIGLAAAIARMVSAAASR